MLNFVVKSQHINYRFKLLTLTKAEFSEKSQVSPLGSMTDTQRATSSKGVREGAMNSKGDIGGP